MGKFNGKNYFYFRFLIHDFRLNKLRKLQYYKEDPKQKEKAEKEFEKVDSIYMDGKNLIKWKTVGNGTWYNQPLWLYLLKQSSRKESIPNKSYY